MLLHLRVASFATIREISLSFDKGLTVITGETGAGKSLLVDALSLIAGQKPRNLSVRPGSSEAIVEASFTPLFSPIPDALSEIITPDDDIVIRRLISPNGRLRQTVNGQAVSTSQLSSLVLHLFDLVGQGESLRMSGGENHRSFLDEYAGTSFLSSDYERLRREILSKRRERLEILERKANLDRSLSDLRERQEDAQLLSGRPGEFEELSATLSAQLNLQEILQSSGRAYQMLSEDEESVLVRLGRISGEIDHILGFDPAAQVFQERLGEAREILKDLAGELRHYQEGLEIDPGQLETLESRFSLYRRLAQKYHVRPEEIVNFLAESGGGDPEAIDRELEIFDQEVSSLHERLLEVGKELSARRKTMAGSFAAAVKESLRRLRIDHPSFTVSLVPYEGDLGGAYGPERVEFLFSANPGMPDRPLGQVASGGETSRVLLAITRALADKDPVPTLIFDEIDSGIGGEVGEVLGDLLREIGQTRQVISITHLHQVARKGEHHILVEKVSENEETTSRAFFVEGEDRVREIARMLGGEKISPSALSIARDLLNPP
ncbi:MAG: DNA repair protein RecN [Leptospirillia bacterium]